MAAHIGIRDAVKCIHSGNFLKLASELRNGGELSEKVILTATIEALECMWGCFLIDESGNFEMKEKDIADMSDVDVKRVRSVFQKALQIYNDKEEKQTKLLNLPEEEFDKVCEKEYEEMNSQINDVLKNFIKKKYLEDLSKLKLNHDSIKNEFVDKVPFKLLNEGESKTYFNMESGVAKVGDFVVIKQYDAISRKTSLYFGYIARLVEPVEDEYKLLLTKCVVLEDQSDSDLIEYQDLYESRFYFPWKTVVWEITKAIIVVPMKKNPKSNEG